MWIGICPIEDGTNRSKQLLHNFLGWLAVLTLMSMVPTSLLRSYDYGLADLENALNAAISGVASPKILLSLISMIASRQKVTLLLKNLQAFHDQSKFIIDLFFRNRLLIIVN